MDRTVPPERRLSPVVDTTWRWSLLANEALVRQTYKDSANVLTRCVGMTNATGHRVERYIGNPQPLHHQGWASRND